MDLHGFWARLHFAPLWPSTRIALADFLFHKRTSKLCRYFSNSGCHPNSSQTFSGSSNRNDYDMMPKNMKYPWEETAEMRPWKCRLHDVPSGKLLRNISQTKYSTGHLTVVKKYALKHLQYHHKSKASFPYCPHNASVHKSHLGALKKMLSLENYAFYVQNIWGISLAFESLLKNIFLRLWTGFVFVCLVLYCIILHCMHCASNVLPAVPFAPCKNLYYFPALKLFCNRRNSISYRKEKLCNSFW